MNYIIRNKNKYLKYVSENHITWTSTLSLAHQFTYDKAKAILSNCIPLKIRKLCTLESVVQDDTSEKSYDYIQLSKTIFDSGEFDWINMCSSIGQFINQLPQYKSNLEDQYKEVELEKTDLEHYIEFFNMNASQGYKAFKMLQDIRRKRRKIKDEIMIVDILIDSTMEDYTSGRVLKRINGLNERKYSPRILTELFNS